MTKKVMLLLLALSLTVGVLLTGCKNEAKILAQFQQDYDKLQLELKEKRKAVNSRETYQAYKKESQEKLDAFSKTLEGAGKFDGLDLLRGKLLMDLGKNEDALKMFDELIQKGSTLAGDAKFQKVRAYLASQKAVEAETLFKEIESSLQKNKEYYEIIMALAYMTPKPEDQAQYARSFLAGAGDEEEFKDAKASMYELLSDQEKSRGNIAEAKRLLEEALTKVKGTDAEADIAMALKRISLVGAPAPAFPAENWLNGSAQELAKLKGKVVIIDFWAPWCPPCRAVIPALVKMYNELKVQGLVVIGYTKLYGSYRDDVDDKGQQPPEEERKLIQGFVNRLQITYPVAIADAGAVFDAYGVRGIPTLVVIDKTGNVHDIKVGSGDEASLEIKIRELLLKK